MHIARQCAFLKKIPQKYFIILLAALLLLNKQSRADNICAADAQQEQQAIAAYIYLASTSYPQDFLIPLEKGKFNFPELKVLRNSMAKFDKLIPLGFGNNVFIIEKSMKPEYIAVKDDPNSIGHSYPQPSTFIVESKNEVTLIFSGSGPANITIIWVDKCFNASLKFNSMELKNFTGFNRYGMLENPVCRIMISPRNKIRIYEDGMKGYYDTMFFKKRKRCSVGYDMDDLMDYYNKLKSNQKMRR